MQPLKANPLSSVCSTSNESIQRTVVGGHTFSVSKRYDFTDCRILGIGTYGVVSKAKDTLTEQMVAIKRIRPYADDVWDARHTLREIRLMKLLNNHPNVCHIKYIKILPASIFKTYYSLYR